MWIYQNPIANHYISSQHHGSKFSSLITETPVPEYLGAHYSVNGDRKDGYQVSWVFFTHVLLTAPFGLHYVWSVAVLREYLNLLNSRC